MSAQTPIITFYSFKGGAGRTVCTANFTAAFAKQIGASKDTPVLLLDMDLDSAGMTMMLELANRFGSYSAAGLLAGSVNLDIRVQREALFEKGLIDVSKTMRTGPRSVLFLGTEVAPRTSVPAGGTSREPLGDLIDECRERKFAGVIIDSASGSQDSARVCQLTADVVVCCLRMTNQFYYGTRSHLRSFIAERCGKIPSILLVPVAVPVPSRSFAPVYRNSMQRLRTVVSELRKEKKGLRIELFEPGIGEVEVFKWTESILSPNDRRPDASQAASRFNDLAIKVLEIARAPKDSRKGE